MCSSIAAAHRGGTRRVRCYGCYTKLILKRGRALAAALVSLAESLALGVTVDFAADGITCEA
ncbi:hypothetical protein SAMN05216227_10184 [Pseudorhodobacter antarcticus]|uniref:Uncharacterized protein n=1 Tax=Pseudorhodobacter antarcticus TaxID=1077947 RepID=A0A1H8HSJ7_9RHOB|nr:hypothetical protein SAMN05216227_10184 [Pseudorhodobacter antarcticus]